ncbi:MAG: 2-dehydro-3-deoxy-6-phosphogalactonate aldolase [Alphaproteobacteria bacterium]|nr:2-dehydro-3-deoxy-6-phosphogalactonate aldolase [Alphaproteobacteria bacterium]
MTATLAFREALGKSRIIAILRNLAPADAVTVGEALLGEGIPLMEVPLNSAEAWESLSALAQGLGNKAIVGAGTVLSAQDVGRVSARGGKFILSPNMDAEVVSVTNRLGLASIPGIATPTEAFAAIKIGVSALKLFPGQIFSIPVIKAFQTVLPPDVPLVLSGGIGPANIKTFADAGVAGFGIASALFEPGVSPSEVGKRAAKLISALGRR